MVIFKFSLLKFSYDIKYFSKNIYTGKNATLCLKSEPNENQNEFKILKLFEIGESFSFNFSYGEKRPIKERLSEAVM